MIDQLYSLTILFAIALATYGVGQPLLRGLGLRQDDRLTDTVWSVGLGLIAAGMLLAVLGWLGLLYAPIIWLLTLAADCWATAEIMAAYMRHLDQQPPEGEAPIWPETPEQPPCSPPPWWLSRGLLAAAGVACLGALLSALAPPTAGDALAYHLELPKRFLLDHRLAFLPLHDNSTYPLLGEMWFLWGLALDGGVAAQLVHWALGLLLALGAVVLATPIIGRPWAWLAGALVVLTPGINNEMTAPMNDVALAAMTTLAVAAWWRAAVNDEGRRWYLLAGLAGGAALGVKYLAVIFGLAWAGVWLWLIVREPRRRTTLLEGAAIVAVVAMSVGGPWYLRAAWHRGNPVYPFLSEVFAADAGEAPFETLPESKAPVGRNPMRLAALPWQTTMHPEHFGGRSHQLGVLLMAAVPGLLFCRRLRGLGVLLMVAAGYAVLWALLRQNVRFLFPIVPLLALAAAWVAIEARRFPAAPRWITAGAFGLVLVALTVVPLDRARRHLAVALGLESREDYLLRCEPSYRAAMIANGLMTPADHLLTEDYRAFYFQGRVTRECIYRRETGYDKRLASPAELVGQLRRDGFTHLLLEQIEQPADAALDRPLSRLVDAQGKQLDGPLVTLIDYRERDTEGQRRRYRLVMLRR